MRITGHTVLVTGGASGIGLALTERFVRHGNKVIVVGRNEGKLAELGARYPDIATIACDIGKPREAEELVKRLYGEYPNLSVLVNNAGIQYNYTFRDIVGTDSISKISEEFGINLIAPVELTARLLPLLASRDEAAIVNVSSGLAIAPKKSAPVYCASKAGLRLFSKALRYQLESTPVRVFEIIPPLVDTEMTQGRGKGKISAEKLAEEFWRAYRLDRLEVAIGKVKLLKLLSRFAPSVADRILKNS